MIERTLFFFQMPSTKRLAANAKAKFGESGRRSLGEKSNYTILDTYGELGKVYCAADVVVIGGGFDNQGGQNLIQPLAHGKPVILYDASSRGSYTYLNLARELLDDLEVAA